MRIYKNQKRNNIPFSSFFLAAGEEELFSLFSPNFCLWFRGDAERGKLYKSQFSLVCILEAN